VVKTVACIGLGTMGKPMALQVIGAGLSVNVYDLQPHATDQLAQAGAKGCDSPRDASNGVDIVLLSLPGPTEVVEAITGTDGVLQAETLPAVIVDLSTNSVETVRELAAQCETVGVGFVDAPVSGGVAKAQTGELSVMVGGDPQAVALAKPALEAIGTDIFEVGPVGSGTIAKLVNNQLFLAGAVLVQESYALAHGLGMDLTVLDEVVSASSGNFYNKLAPLLLGRRFDDVPFRLDIAAKDVAMAVEAAQSVNAPTPLTRQAADIYRRATEAGDGHQAFHATLKELEREANYELPPLRRSRKKA